MSYDKFPRLGKSNRAGLSEKCSAAWHSCSTATCSAALCAKLILRSGDRRPPRSRAAREIRPDRAADEGWVMVGRPACDLAAGRLAQRAIRFVGAAPK
jgi:hypothetical protein